MAVCSLLRQGFHLREYGYGGQADGQGSLWQLTPQE